MWGNDAFANTGIASLTLTDGLASIGEGAFMNSTNLASLEIPSSVTSIGDEAFYGCTSLTSLVIPATVTAMGEYSFRNCTDLVSLTLSDGITAISKCEFEGCTSLAVLEIPDSVTTISDGAFFGCSGLTSVTIPDSVTYIGKEAFYVNGGLDASMVINGPVGYIGDEAFYKCRGLTSVTVLGPMSYIGQEAFDGCTGLTLVNIAGPVKAIGYHAFNSSKASISISGPVTSIGYAAFEYCLGLKTIHLSNDTKGIGQDAFVYCDNLKNVYVGCGCELDIANADNKDVGCIKWANPEIITYHDYDITYDWSEDGKQCDISMKCQAHPNADCSFKASSTMEVIMEPTCTEPGEARYIVQGDHENCNYFSYVDKAIPPSHIYVSTVISPSCEEGGYTNHTCRVCGHSYDDDFTDATGHSYSSSIISPTCTEYGCTLHTCSNCGDTYSDNPTDPLGHDFSPEYDWASDGSACTVLFVCSRNSTHTLSENVTSTSEKVSDPTFSSKGVTRYSISGTYDGISYSDSIEIADIDYVPEEEGGVTVYEDVIQPGVGADVTELFEAAQVVNGEVCITIPSDMGELTLLFDRNAAASIGGNAVTLTASIYLEDPEYPDAKLVLEITPKT